MTPTPRARLPTLGQLRTDAAVLTTAAGTGRTSTTAYDTALLAAVRDPADPRRRLFPAALAWLRDHQHADGSWGALIPTAHDRLVSTLAALHALTGHEQAWAGSAAARATSYLVREATSWTGQFPDTIGFELVVPHLLDLARCAGRALPYHAWAPLEQLRAAKLAKIPPARLFEGSANLAFSAEFLADAAPEQLRRLKTANGSYACSPSASAAAWEITRDADTMDYLAATTAACGDGGAPAIYPMEVFDRAWVLGPLGAAGLLGPQARDHARFLLSAIGPEGAAASQVGPAPDSDTTAMAIIAAHSAGLDGTDRLEALLRFEGPGYFRCFDFERDPSISANARVRHALSTLTPRYQAQVAKLDSFLADARTPSGQWHDKWHLSPYYTSAVVVAGGTDRPWPWQPTLRWLLDSQNRDGSWGIQRGTREETAYAVLMLDRLADDDNAAAARAITSAAAFLSSDDSEIPEMWIAKSLYAPLHVVEAYVLAALAISVRRSRAAAA